MTPDSLHALDDSALEALWAGPSWEGRLGGSFRGSVIRRFDHPAARSFVNRATQIPAFEWISWGVDFDVLRWWFVHPALVIGHFEALPRESRWRPGPSLGLHYHPSRLPIGGLLYDEVKPLGPDVALGIGGVNGDRGVGDHFWFVLGR